MTWHVTPTQQVATCLVCAVFTPRVHSRYTRTLADLPWGSTHVRWQLRVRKFVCANGQCPRQIFTERLPEVVVPWARRTRRLVAWLLAIGLALGGAAGMRLRRCLGCPLSRQTLLRLIRRLSLAGDRTLRVLGVEDFAFRKRQTYGTVLIDLECQQPGALLPDREAETLAQWLQAHPGVEVITRDWARASADGARHGAPEAMQVADRFHLRQNLVEALEQVFQTHHQALAAVNEALRRQEVSLADGTVAVAVPPPATDQAGEDGPAAGPPDRVPSAGLGVARPRVAWLVVRHEAQCTTDDAQQLAQLRAQHADVGEAIDLAQDFAQLVRQRQPQKLEPWLAHAAKSAVGTWRRFAKGLRDEFDAVKAVVTRPWRSGPVEGQMTRLKRLKCQMCGRASLTLLERRVVRDPG